MPRYRMSLMSHQPATRALSHTYIIYYDVDDSKGELSVGEVFWGL